MIIRVFYLIRGFWVACEKEGNRKFLLKIRLRVWNERWFRCCYLIFWRLVRIYIFLRRILPCLKYYCCIIFLIPNYRVFFFGGNQIRRENYCFFDSIFQFMIHLRRGGFNVFYYSLHCGLFSNDTKYLKFINNWNFINILKYCMFIYKGNFLFYFPFYWLSYIWMEFYFILYYF